MTLLVIPVKKSNSNIAEPPGDLGVRELERRIIGVLASSPIAREIALTIAMDRAAELKATVLIFGLDYGTSGSPKYGKGAGEHIAFFAKYYAPSGIAEPSVKGYVPRTEPDID